MGDFCCGGELNRLFTSQVLNAGTRCPGGEFDLLIIFGFYVVIFFGIGVLNLKLGFSTGESV